MDSRLWFSLGGREGVACLLMILRTAWEGEQKGWDARVQERISQGTDSTLLNTLFTPWLVSWLKLTCLCLRMFVLSTGLGFRPIGSLACFRTSVLRTGKFCFSSMDFVEATRMRLQFDQTLVPKAFRSLQNYLHQNPITKAISTVIGVENRPACARRALARSLSLSLSNVLVPWCLHFGEH